MTTGGLCINTVTLNRPKALNALSSPLFKELNEALSKYDDDDDIGAIVITGSEKAFAGTYILIIYQIYDVPCFFIFHEYIPFKKKKKKKTPNLIANC